MKQILTVANKEFHDGLRNRWLISITLIFALLSIGSVSYTHLTLPTTPYV